MAGAAAVRRIKLGSQGLEVSARGLGCMSMSFAYGQPKPEEDMINLLCHAINSGVTFLDTSDVYGPHTNEILIGKALKGGLRRKAACEASLKRLDIDCIDLYYQHRVDTTVPIEVTMGELKKLVEEGKIKYVGLSEACGSTIRRAHAVHPLTAVQIEWSLWTRDVEEEIVPTCRELGIGIVAYSPIGRGFFALGPKVVDTFSDNDFRKLVPRFEPENCWEKTPGKSDPNKNMDHNKLVFEKLKAMATRKGCTPSQLALAWVHHQGNDVCPIPGTIKKENFNQNVGALSVILTLEEVTELESFSSGEAIKVSKVTSIPTWQDSETPPLSSWRENDEDR
ncbi:hypothetical protein Nepgr_020473 [Nepenthes gracilis]|uniref:NADP-dependent oxidoreductase domain-containing protein n=1 Tax=Nepenthes gracilis TaxID=150966 RepID=A0AAD3SY52_NEPGR|nr:hypothetical protein Nepgr_020473 [Nepenthes gracilis]